jgi:hypothetical protein
MRTKPTEDEVAAALAAISCYLTEESSQTAQESEWRWRASDMLSTQKICVIRSPQRPQWGKVERLRRAGRGCPGIVGM